MAAIDGLVHDAAIREFTRERIGAGAAKRRAS